MFDIGAQGTQIVGQAQVLDFSGFGGLRLPDLRVEAGVAGKVGAGADGGATG